MGRNVSILSASMAALLVACAPSTVSPSPTATVAPSSAAVAWLIEAMDGHNVVAIGETHRSVRQHEVFRALIADPRLPTVIDDIAVEFGTSNQQAVMDRYIGGGDVADADLQRVWTETTQQSGVWNAPMYEAFFTSVRAANQGLDPDSRMRVLLGDPDLEVAQECPPPEDDCFDRDGHFAEVIQRESLDQGRRVLIVAGMFHVLRDLNPHVESVVDLLEQDAGAATFVVMPLEGPILRQPELATFVEPLNPPHAGPMDGTPIGELGSGILRGDTTVTCDNPPCETPESEGTLASIADAYLYLGP